MSHHHYRHRKIIIRKDGTWWSLTRRWFLFHVDTRFYDTFDEALTAGLRWLAA